METTNSNGGVYKIQWGKRLSERFDPLLNDPRSPVTWYRRLKGYHAEALHGYDPVLDVAIGTGNFIGDLLNDGHEIVYGIDKNPSAIRILKQRHRKEIAEGKVIVRVADAHEIPHVDGTFGGVNNLISINFFQDSVKHIAETYRVIREGGRLVVSGPLRDWDANRMNAEMEGEVQEYLKRHEKGPEDPEWKEYKDLLLAFGTHLLECKHRWSISNFDSDEIEKMLRDAGYGRVKVKTGKGIGCGVEYLAVADKLPPKPFLDLSGIGEKVSEIFSANGK